MVKASRGESRKAFKDYFDQEAAEALAKQFVSAHPGFDANTFKKQACKGLQKLEFNQRVAQFAAAIRRQLPKNTTGALEVVRESLPPPLPHCEAVTDGWLQWPLGQLIADLAPEADHDVAFDVMTELTQRFSAEFAVRPYVQSHPEKSLERLLALTSHPSAHVRRWCSEGCRPRLPWGAVLRDFVKDPTPVWPILERLLDDPERYVERSVANNLNDIAKDHPDEVAARCGEWLAEEPKRLWLIKHALRSLIKDGHPGALEVLGYGPPKGLEVSLSMEQATVAIGEELHLRATLKNQSEKQLELLVDLGVGYVRKKGEIRVKVFKWKTLSLGPGETQVLEKAHKFAPTTIRALYPGSHTVLVQVNGQVFAEGGFELLSA